MGLIARKRVLQNKKLLVVVLLIGLPVLYAGTVFWVERAPSITGNRFELSDTRHLAYTWLHHGKPDAPPVVLIHGSPATAASWNKLAEVIPADFPNSILALDRLGYGNATRESVTTLDVHAAAIQKLFSALELEPIIIGHSYGGPVALRIAAEYPNQIEGLILVAGACSPHMKDSIWFREWVDAMGSLIPQPWSHANAELLALTDENRSMAKLLDRVISPVTIIHGEWDPVCPYETTVSYLQTALPNSVDLTVKSLARTGHNIHRSHPEIILAEIVHQGWKSGREH